MIDLDQILHDTHNHKKEAYMESEAFKNSLIHGGDHCHHHEKTVRQNKIDKFRLGESDSGGLSESSPSIGSIANLNETKNNFSGRSNFTDENSAS